MVLAPVVVHPTHHREDRRKVRPETSDRLLLSTVVLRWDPNREEVRLETSDRRLLLLAAVVLHWHPNREEVRRETSDRLLAKVVLRWDEEVRPETFDRCLLLLAAVVLRWDPNREEVRPETTGRLLLATVVHRWDDEVRPETSDRLHLAAVDLHWHPTREEELCLETADRLLLAAAALRWDLFLLAAVALGWNPNREEEVRPETDDLPLVEVAALRSRPTARPEIDDRLPVLLAKVAAVLRWDPNQEEARVPTARLVPVPVRVEREAGLLVARNHRAVAAAAAAVAAPPATRAVASPPPRVQPVGEIGRPPGPGPECPTTTSRAPSFPSETLPERWGAGAESQSRRVRSCQRNRTRGGSAKSSPTDPRDWRTPRRFWAAAERPWCRHSDGTPPADLSGRRSRSI